MKTIKLFNPDGSDAIADRKLWTGNSTNLMNLNNIKYNWALGLYNQMRENFWIPNKIDTTGDITDYKDLTEDERTTFNNTLSYLTFLDSIQSINLAHLLVKFTAPEASLCIGEQISQEKLHSSAYQVMIENIIPSNKRQQVYDLCRTEKVLRDRCDYIANLFQQYLDDKTDENYYIALVADYLLEGLYFFNGFMVFYNFVSRGMMSGSSDMISLIHRDELSHVRIFQKLLPDAKVELLNNKNHLDDKVYEIVDNAVQQEIKWANHNTNNKILGITERTIDQYTKYIANYRLRAIGFDPLYDEYKDNPYSHLEKFADLGQDANKKANFFEASPTSYNMSEAVEGWNF